MMINLANCCWWQIKTGNNIFNRELFEIHKIWIEKGYLVKPEYRFVEIQVFKNIVYAALNIGEIDWAEWFLRSYSGSLSPDNSKAAISYCYALLYYNKKDYSKALDELKLMDHRNYQHKMECQLLTLKIYYELNAAENLLSLADSYLHYLKKIEEDNILVGKRHLNFTKAIIKLQSLKDNFTIKKHNELLNFAVNNSLIASKNWLLNELNKINKKFKA